MALDWIKARMLPALSLLLAAALIFGGVQSYRVGSLKATIREMTEALFRARAGFVVLKARIIDRTAEARRADAANVDRVKAEQSAISKDRVHAYQLRIDALNARVAELRRAGARGSGAGGGGATAMPAPSSASGRADGAAAGDRFSLELRAVATRQAIQLDELQKWVADQGQVDNSGAPAPLPLSSDETAVQPGGNAR